MPTKFYHGSNRMFTAFELGTDERFYLLGKGIYFYEKWQSALNYGSYLYEARIPKSLKIASLDFRLSDSDLSEIFPSVDMPDMVGIYNPLWWATDGWNIIEWQRNATIEAVVAQMMKNGFDGMLADYPKGGLVLVLWRKYSTLPIRLIDPPKQKSTFRR